MDIRTGAEDHAGRQRPMDRKPDEDNAAGDDLWDLQARHGTYIAGMIYARELIEGNNTIISRWEKFRQGNATRGTKPVEEVADSRRLAGIGRNVQGGHTVPWVAEARVGGHHEAREPYIGGDGDWCGEVDVILDSGKERVIRDDHCHHAESGRGGRDEDPESRDAAVGGQTGRVGEDGEVFEQQCEVGEERCDMCEKDDAMVKDGEARQAAYVEEQRVIQEQAVQAERERQGWWVDSGIDVPSSSMNILAPSSEVLVTGSVVVTSPQLLTDQDITSSEEGHSIPRSRCSSVSFDKGFAADHDPVGESCLDVDVQHTLEDCPDESRTKVITEIEALRTIRFEPYAS
ncbi:hypothetical protein V493_04079, partial [Pseudogymnoascus sp. VKM F-4281 (FW-2241)]